MVGRGSVSAAERNDPENGAVTYAYGSNSLIATKTDASRQTRSKCRGVELSEGGRFGVQVRREKLLFVGLVVMALACSGCGEPARDRSSFPLLRCPMISIVRLDT
jgi:hypothetical protein